MLAEMAMKQKKYISEADNFPLRGILVGGAESVGIAQNWNSPGRPAEPGLNSVCVDSVAPWLLHTCCSKTVVVKLIFKNSILFGWLSR